jgi:hypothetical protein
MIDRPVRILSLGVMAGCALLGCASTPAPAPRATTVYVDVHQGSTQGEVPAGIHLSDPRIGVANQALARLLGHTLEFEIDPALVRQFGEGLHDAYVSALETAPRRWARAALSPRRRPAEPLQSTPAGRVRAPPRTPEGCRSSRRLES